MSWHCTSVTNAEHTRYGYCTKVDVTVTNDVFAVLCRKLYLVGVGLRGWYWLGLDVDLTLRSRSSIKQRANCSVP
jgi:hypothetical protein